jgi:hypothetical protein
LYFHFEEVYGRKDTVLLHAIEDAVVAKSFAFGYVAGSMYYEGYLASCENDHDKMFLKIQKDINALVGYSETKKERAARDEVIGLGLNFELLGE